MGAVDDIVSAVSLDQLAGELGTDPHTAEAAVRAAVPELLGALQNNAGDPHGARGLAGALGDHAQDGLYSDDSVDLSAVDVADGEKMVGHIFGGNDDTAAHAVAQRASLGGQGVSSDVIKKLLPILAPIVLSYIVSKMGGGLLSQILGQVLGQGAGAQVPTSNDGGLGLPTPGQPTSPQQADDGGLGGILGSLKDVLGGR